MISEKAKKLYWQGKDTLMVENRPIKIDAKAQRLFRKAIEDSPDFAEAHFMAWYLETFTEQYGSKAQDNHWRKARAIARKKNYIPVDQDKFEAILDSMKPQKAISKKRRIFTQEEVDELLLSAIGTRTKNKRRKVKKKQNA